MQFIYKGEDERTFPSISKTLQPNEIFEAPDDFVAHNVEPVSEQKDVANVSTDDTNKEEVGE